VVPRFRKTTYGPGDDGARTEALQRRRPVVGTQASGGIRVNQRQLKPFHRLLVARRQELLEEAERTVGGMTDSKENFPDPTDRASLESNRNAVLRIRDRERKLLTKIDDALQRIADGSYGLCEACDSPIGLDRLRARPVTTLCIDCKSDQEAQERRLRGL
jgi:DnaK suppressor protein